MNKFVSPSNALDFFGFLSKYIILSWIIIWVVYRFILFLAQKFGKKRLYYRVNHFINEIKHKFLLINVFLFILYLRFFIYKPLFLHKSMLPKYSSWETLFNLSLLTDFFTIIWDIKREKASKIKKMEYHLFLEKNNEIIICKVLHRSEYILRFIPLENINSEDYRTIYSVSNKPGSFSIVSSDGDIRIGSRTDNPSEDRYLLSYENGIRKQGAYFIKYNFEIRRNSESLIFNFDFEYGESKIVIYCKNFPLNITEKNIFINEKKNEENYNLYIKKIDNYVSNFPNPKSSVSVIEIHRNFNGCLNVELTDI